MDDKTWLGALAEARVAARFLHERWDVFVSAGGKAPFDLVAARGEQLPRVEVKGCATSDYAMIPDGAVAEWTKATALKVVDLQGSVGSNPTRSARVSSFVHPGVVAESG